MESMKPGASQTRGVGGTSAATAGGLRFSHLSAPRQALLRLCQTVNYGSFENLVVRNSEPIFDPPPVVLKDVKLDSDDGSRPELALHDFAVSDEALRLMSLLDEMKCGTVRRIDVRAGIPRRIVLESQVLSAPGPRPRSKQDEMSVGSLSRRC
jgi:hypothetical protein